jgi:hydrogenase/urease accessory protein HupE
MRRLIALLGALLAGALVLCAAVPHAQAHDESLSTSDVVVDQHTISWTVDVGVSGLAKAVALPAGETTLGEAALASVKDAVGRALSAGLELSANGRALTAELGALQPRYERHAAGARSELARAAQTFVFRSPEVITTIHARVAFFSQLTSQHRALIHLRWGKDTRQFVRRGPTEITVAAGDVAPSTASLVGELLRWGMFHIFQGTDHLAFLLALLLAVTRLKELVSIVTAFTVAHSVTLLLAALDVLRVPVRLTEVLIAASIVYIAAENLAWGRSAARYRWLITFGFGLVHGCGFATEIKDRLAEIGGHVALPVIAFNLGVEVGQLAIVALVYPLLARLRRAPTEAARALRHRRLVIAGSLPILLAGLYWLLDRLSG